MNFNNFSIESVIRSDLSLRIDTVFGDSGSGVPSGAGVINLLNDPPHRLDALLYGALSNFGYGVDYKHINGHGLTILLTHALHTSNSLDLNTRINLFTSSSSSSQINIQTFCNVIKYFEDETFFKYGSSIDFIHINNHGISIGIQQNTYTDDTIVDFTIKQSLFIRKSTSIEISIKATKTFNFVNYFLTRPLNLIFELTFSRVVK